MPSERDELQSTQSSIPSSSTNSVTGSASTAVPSLTSTAQAADTSTAEERDSSSLCDTCPKITTSGIFCEPTQLLLLPNEFLFDYRGSTYTSQVSLSSCIRELSESTLYSKFFSHAQIVQRDSVRCYSSYYNHPNANRYIDIPCLEDNRVKVVNVGMGHDYIHANYVDGFRELKKYIVTQAPLPSTTVQFWQMIWQEKVTVVTSMLQMWDVAPSSLGMISLRYIPKVSGEIMTFGDIQIENSGVRRIRDAYDAAVLKVRKDGEERKVLQLIYFAWTDKGSPTRPSELLNFIADMNMNRDLLIKVARDKGWLKPGEHSPVLIHCLAGTGRSCTVVALDIACRTLDFTAVQLKKPIADVQEVVLRLRTQRAMAIQKPEQYVLLHLSVLEYAIRMGYLTERDYDDVNLQGFLYKRIKEIKMTVPV